MLLYIFRNVMKLEGFTEIINYLWNFFCNNIVDKSLMFALQYASWLEQQDLMLVAMMCLW